MKSYYTFTLHQPLILDSNQPPRDPVLTQWETYGINPQLVDDTLPDSSVFFYVTHTERVLPKPAIRRAVGKLVRDYIARNGNTPKRKEIARITNDYISEALPTTPIKETLVPCIATPTHLFLGTTTPKKAEAILKMLGASVTPTPVSFESLDRLHANPPEPFKVGVNISLNGNEKVTVSDDESQDITSDLMRDHNLSITRLQLVKGHEYVFAIDEYDRITGLSISAVDKKNPEGNALIYYGAVMEIFTTLFGANNDI